MAAKPAKNEDLDDEPLGLEPETGKGEKEDADPGGDVVDGEEDATAGEELEIVLADDELAEEDPEKKKADEEPLKVSESSDDEELSEDDKRTLSRNVQERIRREVRLRKRAVEAAEGRAQVEAQARQAAEKKAMDLELVTTKMAEENIEGQIKDVVVKLKASKEAGETDKEVDLQQQLNDLQGRKREVLSVKATLEDRAEKAKAAPVETKPSIRPITQEWMGRNTWFGHKDFVVATVAAKTIDSQMSKEGWDPADVKYYAELDRRLHSEMPNLRSRLRQRNEARPGNRPGPGTTVAPAKSPPARGGSPNRVVLTKEDLANARAYGIDTNDKKQLREYAMVKLKGNINV